MSSTIRRKDVRGLSRSDQVYEFVVNSIRDGSLVPGTRLREIELASQLNLSRTPVREALGRLQMAGLATNDPARGLIVTELDHAATSELYVMRETLEGTAARLAAKHASDAEIDFLADINERDAELADPQQLANNNRLFHGTLYQCAHNRYLLKTLNSLQESMILLGPTTLIHSGRPAEARLEHQNIVEALRRRDPDAAETAARAHILAAYRIRLGALLNDGDITEADS